jgi:hypothetical protein
MAEEREERDPLWPVSNPTVREQWYNKWMEEGPPPGINLEAYRENRNGKTFSADVMEALFDQMAAYLAARMKTEWEQAGKPPHHIRIKVDVELET